MIIGVPKEIKDKENRVALTPGGAHALVAAGHRLLVQAHAGDGSGFPDPEYLAAGATLVPHPADVWGAADLVLKVKEPLPPEYPFLRP
ncbi:MAG TPA: alanine dehydrogenase, partial [Anaerolineae bacterium]